MIGDMRENDVEPLFLIINIKEVGRCAIVECFYWRS